MTDSLFDFVADQLEERTELDALEARGTLRIALTDAGLEARGLVLGGLLATLARTLPKHLATRGVGDPEGLCAHLAEEVRRAPGFTSPAGPSPEDVFRRLSRG